MKKMIFTLVIVLAAHSTAYSEVWPEDIQASIIGDDSNISPGNPVSRQYEIKWDFFEADFPYEVQGISCGILLENSNGANSYINNASLHSDVIDLAGDKKLPDFIVINFYEEGNLQNSAGRTGDGTTITGTWKAVTQVLVFDFQQLHNLPAPVEEFGSLNLGVVFQSETSGTTTLSFTDGIGTPPKATAVVVANNRIQPASQLELSVVFTSSISKVYTGDANCDKSINLADAICILSFLFGPSTDPCKTPCCKANEDTNDDNLIDLADAINVLSFLFNSTEMKAPDGTPLGSAETGCKAYNPSDIKLPCETGCTSG